MLRLIALLAAFVLAPLANADWSRVYGPNGNNTLADVDVPRSLPEGGPSVDWTIDVGPGFGGASVHGDEVFILDREDQEKDTIRCLDFATGDEKWRVENPLPGRLPYNGSRCVPLVTDDMVYAASGFGHAYAVDRATKKLKWKLDLAQQYNATVPRFGYSYSPILEDGKLFLTPLGDTLVIAVDPETGKEIWKSKGYDESNSSPAIMTLHGQKQVVMTSILMDAGKVQLVGLNFDTGETLWHYEFNKFDRNHRCIPSLTQIDDDTIFYTNGYRAGAAMYDVVVNDGKMALDLKWTTKRGSQIHQPIVVDDHIYLIANENANLRGSAMREGGLVCFDLDGNEKWRTGDSPNFSRGSMLLLGDRFVIQDGADGVLRIVEPDPAGYKQLAEADIFKLNASRDQQLWAPMAYSDGKLLMRSQNQLKCVQLVASK